MPRFACKRRTPTERGVAGTTTAALVVVSGTDGRAERGRVRCMCSREPLYYLALKLASAVKTPLLAPVRFSFKQSPGIFCNSDAAIARERWPMITATGAARAKSKATASTNDTNILRCRCS